MVFRELLFPQEHGRTYGFASAALLVLVVMAEIEGLAFIAIGLLLGNTELFLQVQLAIFPAAAFVGFATGGVVLWRARAWRRRYHEWTEEVSRSTDLTSIARRIGR